MKILSIKIVFISIVLLSSINQLFAQKIVATTPKDSTVNVQKGIAIGQEGVVTIEQDRDITKLLEYKKDIKTVNLYKIQLDFGSRSEAITLRQKFENTFAEWPSELVYETPNYKVWVGNFSTRLEADIALLKIKKKFSKAMVFEPKKED